MNEDFKTLLKTAINTYPTQKEFAQVSGISNEHISRMLNSNSSSRPNISTLKKIANHANGSVSLHDLYLACDYDESKYLKDLEQYNRINSYATQLQYLQVLPAKLKSNQLLLKQKTIYYSIYDFLITVTTITDANLDFKIIKEQPYLDDTRPFAEYLSIVNWSHKEHKIGTSLLYFCKTERGFVLITDVEYQTEKTP